MAATRIPRQKPRISGNRRDGMYTAAARPRSGIALATRASSGDTPMRASVRATSTGSSVFPAAGMRRIHRQPRPARFSLSASFTSGASCVAEIQTARWRGVGWWRAGFVA